MKLRTKYKIARRVGAPIFEKTQTPKYAQRLERKKKTAGFSRSKSEFGLQQNEKQKARLTYGLSERQFSGYVREATEKHSSNAAAKIFEYLEYRLDNTVARIGLASTRRAARQMVSHGHITVNGRRVTIPSIRLKIGDKIGIREGSKDKKLFLNIDKSAPAPAWVKYDKTAKVAEVVGLPQYIQTENMFDLNSVIEFYSR